MQKYQETFIPKQRGDSRADSCIQTFETHSNLSTLQQTFNSTAVHLQQQGREANPRGLRRARLAQEAAAASGATNGGSGGGRVPVRVSKPEDVAFVADTAQRVDNWLRVRDPPD